MLGKERIRKPIVEITVFLCILWCLGRLYSPSFLPTELKNAVRCPATVFRCMMSHIQNEFLPGFLSSVWSKYQFTLAVDVEEWFHYVCVWRSCRFDHLGLIGRADSYFWNGRGHLQRKVVGLMREHNQRHSMIDIYVWLLLLSEFEFWSPTGNQRWLCRQQAWDTSLLGNSAPPWYVQHTRLLSFLLTHALMHNHQNFSQWCMDDPAVPWLQCLFPNRCRRRNSIEISVRPWHLIESLWLWLDRRAWHRLISSTRRDPCDPFHLWKPSIQAPLVKARRSWT